MEEKKFSYLVVQVIEPRESSNNPLKNKGFAFGDIEGMTENEAVQTMASDEVEDVRKISELMKEYQKTPGWEKAPVSYVCNNYINSIAKREGIGSRGLR